MKTYKARITFLLAMIGVLVLCMESYSLNADEGGTTNFRQDPTMDFRAVHLDIEKDKDAEFQIVIANPTLNGDVSVSGEVTFRVPTWYDYIFKHTRRDRRDRYGAGPVYRRSYSSW